jgi:vitamin B12 transporter
MKKIYAAALAALVHAGIAFAQTDAPAPSTPAKSGSDSELVVVTVTKNAQVETKVGSAFTRIGSAEIQRAQSVDLTQVLSATPGVFAGDTGARGSIPLVSIRGNRTDHTLFLLDGVRINTAMNQDAKPFLSYAGAENIGSVEIVRGPQSTLYGSEGIGGVVAMETKKGEGKPGVTLFSEAGSFHSFREGIAGGGEFGKTAFSMSYQRDDTCNDRPNNDLSTNRYSLRLDYQPLDNLSLQFNVRGHAGEYQEPGSSRPQDYASNDPGARATGESNLVSAIIDWKVLPQWEQKLTLGAYFERYTFIDPPYAGNYFYPTHYISNAANYSADWQQVVQVAHNNRLTAGLDFNCLPTRARRTGRPIFKMNGSPSKTSA